MNNGVYLSPLFIFLLPLFSMFKQMTNAHEIFSDNTGL